MFTLDRAKPTHEEAIQRLRDAAKATKAQPTDNDKFAEYLEIVSDPDTILTIIGE